MSVRYSELLQKIQPDGFDEAGRFKTEGREMVTIANRREPIVIPFAFPNYPIFLDDGNNSEIEDEVVAGLMRWIARQKRRRR